jgi:hypothetical protein
MSAQAQRDHRGVPQARLRLVASRSAQGRAQQARQTADTVIGHRLANGRMWAHAPGEPCRFCDDERTGRHRMTTRR